MNLNEKINLRSWNSRTEKVKGHSGLGFTNSGLSFREEVIKNGGTNRMAFNRTNQNIWAALKPKFRGMPMHTRGFSK